MEGLVWEYITEHKLIKEGQDVGAAVSGGADSMALLVCLCALGKQHGFGVKCLHFEHGIRGEDSLKDAEFVEEYCTEHGIDMFMGAADVPVLMKEWGVSEETAAKRAREEYFNSQIAFGEVDIIATGHHLDDNAESVLMHILRGSGLSGLRGIHSRYGSFVRPLLCVARADIERYLQQKGISYVNDKTNADSKYTRNYIRNELMPSIAQNINADVCSALNRLSLLAGQDCEYIESEAEKIASTIAKKEGDTVRLDAKALSRLHPAMAGRVVKAACAMLHVVQDVELKHITAVLELARQGKTGAMANLSRSLCVGKEYDSLILSFTGRSVDRSFEEDFFPEGNTRLENGDVIECRLVESCNMENINPYIECFDLDKLPQKLKIRTRQAGDVIRPLNSGGSKKLKDYFIDKKLPRDERDKTPLVAYGSEIIWAVGYVISDLCRVDENTCRILEISYKGPEYFRGIYNRE